MSELYTTGKRGEDQAGQRDDEFRVKARTIDLHELLCRGGGVAPLAGLAGIF